MKVILLFILIVSQVQARTLLSDSARYKKHFIEIKAGGVYFVRGYGNAWITNSNVKGNLSTTLNLSVGRRVKHTRFGFCADYTQFRLIGSPTIVGYYPYKSNTFYPYLIRQNINYSVLTLGTFIHRDFKIGKVIIEPGLSLSSLVYQSALLIQNHFVGEPPHYANNYAGVPDPGGKFTVGENSYVEPMLPIAGVHLDISYDIRNNLRIKLFNSFYYNPDVQLKGANGFMYENALPKSYVYNIWSESWVSSGIAISLGF